MRNAARRWACGRSGSSSSLPLPPLATAAFATIQDQHECVFVCECVCACVCECASVQVPLINGVRAISLYNCAANWHSDNLES